MHEKDVSEMHVKNVKMQICNNRHVIGFLDLRVFNRALVSCSIWRLVNYP